MDNKSIQKLLAAEQEANAKVAEAKAARIALLRRAKAEADVEVAKFRAEMEAQFKAKHTKDMGSRDEYRMQLEVETEMEIESIRKLDANKKRQVIEFLLSKVQQVDTKAPANL
jgi:V-type H+-transporting ATPase subunit G